MTRGQETARPGSQATTHGEVAIGIRNRMATGRLAVPRHLPGARQTTARRPTLTSKSCGEARTRVNSSSRLNTATAMSGLSMHLNLHAHLGLTAQRLDVAPCSAVNSFVLERRCEYALDAKGILCSPSTRAPFRVLGRNEAVAGAVSPLLPSHHPQWAGIHGP